jgi:uncharacterized protein YndB with AHSA1/START domain
LQRLCQGARESLCDKTIRAFLGFLGIFTLMTLPALQISVSIDRPAKDVYDYAANPENLTKWASGLSQSTVKREGQWWVAESPMGQVKIQFAEKNAFGVMDHDVMLPSGEVFHNPMRVVKNGSGSELIFTLYRQPQMDDAAFEADAEMIRQDLKAIKKILER